MTDASGTPDHGTKKEGGLGSEGTIPNEPGGIGVGVGRPTTFEPEEDPEAAANRDDEAPEPRPRKDTGPDPLPDLYP